jgi:effector-binding domain-containing protein
MITAVRVETTPTLPIAAVRRTATGPMLGKTVQDGCGAVWNALRAQGLKGGRNVAIYWDTQITLDVGVEMPEGFTETDDVKRAATPTGLTASVTHLGPYQTLGTAHDAIWAWAKQNGKTLAGPRWEVYGHWLPEWNADPSKIRTDVVYLVTP